MELLKRVPENTNVITCHLGNGASITAIEHGKSIDTSMGFTPLEGLVMGTRSGDIDPAIFWFLETQGYTCEQINTMLNKKSGLLGISGLSNDLRDLEAAAAQGNTRAQLALDVYAYRVRKYIGAYTANLVRVDALVFTGGIGQHGVRMRERICHRLENIGIFMDYGLNTALGSGEGVVSSPLLAHRDPRRPHQRGAADRHRHVRPHLRLGRAPPPAPHRRHAVGARMVTLDFSKLDGLVPAVAQDWQTGEVLMVAFMNERGVAPHPRDRDHALLEPQPGIALEEGRDLGARPGGEGAARGLRRGLRRGPGPPGRRRGVPHRAPQLLLPGRGRGRPAR